MGFMERSSLRQHLKELDFLPWFGRSQIHAMWSSLYSYSTKNCRRLNVVLPCTAQWERVDRLCAPVDEHNKFEYTTVI
jgi:hypothetical protein